MVPRKLGTQAVGARTSPLPQPSKDTFKSVPCALEVRVHARQEPKNRLVHTVATTEIRLTFQLVLSRSPPRS